ncbi:hypothetical protein MSAN_00537600 [Mycena sanguinolenta]|uniref:SAM domain-containing protein n=1 Tax=Mycena sanguinolenta TaxID=230812 RepID=A0A8H7DJ69_9AGAR|nr:hypothetical protein MSAN_00537600 [Mycena sanguinolenta]
MKVTERPEHDPNGPTSSTDLPSLDGSTGGNGGDNSAMSDGNLAVKADIATDDAQHLREEDGLHELKQPISENPDPEPNEPTSSMNLPPILTGGIGGTGGATDDHGDLGEGAHIDVQDFSEEESLYGALNQQSSESADDPRGPSSKSLPILKGGRGGNGGSSGNIGGAGGLGEGAHLSTDHVWFFSEIHGGIGGTGGMGGIEGGVGGVGQGATISIGLLSVEERMLSRPSRLPVLSVGEFCQEYHLSGNIRSLLDKCGFETAEAIFEVSDADLKVAGFKSGQIAEVRRALQVFIYKSQEHDLLDGPIATSSSV